MKIPYNLRGKVEENNTSEFSVAKLSKDQTLEWKLRIRFTLGRISVSTRPSCSFKREPSQADTGIRGIAIFDRGKFGLLWDPSKNHLMP